MLLSLPVEVFSYLGDINSFTIQGGSISNMVSDSFKGLNVKKSLKIIRELLA
jgi:hypothetical protein